jgi:hypothetical protein
MKFSSLAEMEFPRIESEIMTLLLLIFNCKNVTTYELNTMWYPSVVFFMGFFSNSLTSNVCVIWAIKDWVYGMIASISF